MGADRRRHDAQSRQDLLHFLWIPEHDPAVVTVAGPFKR